MSMRHLIFALLYSTIFFLGTLSFVLATIFLRRWEGSTYLCFGDCTVQISIHENARKVLQNCIAFGLLPIIFVAIWLGFVRLFHIMGHQILPHSESRVGVDMCCYDDVLMEIIADVLSAFYNVIYAAVITTAYQAAHHRRGIYGALAQKQTRSEHTGGRIMAILVGIIFMQYVSSLLWCLAIGLNVHLREKYRMATLQHQMTTSG